jgi:hypothetical protein
MNWKAFCKMAAEIDGKENQPKLEPSMETEKSGPQFSDDFPDQSEVCPNCLATRWCHSPEDWASCQTEHSESVAEPPPADGRNRRVAAPSAPDVLFRVEGDYIICNRCNCSNQIIYGSRHYTDCPIWFGYWVWGCSCWWLPSTGSGFCDLD